MELIPDVLMVLVVLWKIAVSVVEARDSHSEWLALSALPLVYFLLFYLARLFDKGWIDHGWQRVFFASLLTFNGLHLIRNRLNNAVRKARGIK